MSVRDIDGVQNYRHGLSTEDGSSYNVTWNESGKMVETFSTISQEKWDSIFGKKEDKDVESNNKI